MIDKDKQKTQLGMNPSTARTRLIKNLLYSMAVKLGEDSCYQCGGKITIDHFSIEHKTPRLDADDPVAAYFELDNISFSHVSCNSGAARKPTKLGIPRNERAVQLQTIKRSKWTDEERREDRRARYTKYGH